MGENYRHRQTNRNVNYTTVNFSHSRVCSREKKKLLQAQTATKSTFSLIDFHFLRTVRVRVCVDRRCHSFKGFSSLRSLF